MRADRDVVVGQVRRKSWVQVAHGLYRRDCTTDERHADLVAWQQVLPRSGCLTHLTAAAVHGLWLPPLPDWVPLFVSMHRSEPRPKRPELKVMRHTKPIAASRHGELVVADVHEALLVAARHLSLVDLVVLGDAALHAQLTTVDQLHRSASRRRWGAAALARAIAWMDGRSESAWESLLRLLHRACGVPVVPQHEVRDADGRFVARADLWLVGTRTLHEYDGAVHRDPQEHRRDLDRDRRLLDVHHVRRGYTAPDILHEPHRILREADAALGRRHRVERLDPWLAMLAESLYTESGQERFAARVGRPQSGR